MSSCKKAASSKHQCNSQPPSSEKKALSDLVEEYLQDWGNFYQNETQWWGDKETLDWKSAQKRAWESLWADGKMHLHQHRVGFKKLAQGWKIAQTKNVQPDRFETFEELYDWVELEVANQVSGLGKLVTYDVALRLGMWLKLEPAVVYLHGGTSKGAEKLNVKGETAPLSAFPPEIQKLGATHAENFLCIYKNRLNRF